MADRAANIAKDSESSMPCVLSTNRTAVTEVLRHLSNDVNDWLTWLTARAELANRTWLDVADEARAMRPLFSPGVGEAPQHRHLS